MMAMVAFRRPFMRLSIGLSFRAIPALGSIARQFEP
jgi:hypothetical protein